MHVSFTRSLKKRKEIIDREVGGEKETKIDREPCKRKIKKSTVCLSLVEHKTKRNRETMRRE